MRIPVTGIFRKKLLMANAFTLVIRYGVGDVDPRNFSTHDNRSFPPARRRLVRRARGTGRCAGRHLQFFNAAPTYYMEMLAPQYNLKVE